MFQAIRALLLIAILAVVALAFVALVWFFLALRDISNIPPEGKAPAAQDESYLHQDQAPYVIPCPVPGGCKG